jgi:hypothetical protein
MNIVKLVLLFVVVAAVSSAAGFFLTRFLIDHHYIAL